MIIHKTITCLILSLAFELSLSPVFAVNPYQKQDHSSETTLSSEIGINLYSQPDYSKLTDEELLAKEKELNYAILFLGPAAEPGYAAAIIGFGYSIMPYPMYSMTIHDLGTKNKVHLQAGFLFTVDKFRLSTDVPGLGKVGDHICEVHGTPLNPLRERLPSTAKQNLQLVAWVNADKNWRIGESIKTRMLHLISAPHLVDKYPSDLKPSSVESTPTDQSNLKVPEDLQIPDDRPSISDDSKPRTSQPFKVADAQAAKDAVLSGKHHLLTASEHLYVADLLYLSHFKPEVEQTILSQKKRGFNENPIKDELLTTTAYWRVRVQNSPTDPGRGGGLTGEYWVNAHTGEVTTIFTRVDKPEASISP